MYRSVSFVALAVILMMAMPADVSAQAGGLIPCDGPECQACDFAQLIKNVLDFLIQFAVTISVILLGITGFQMIYQSPSGSSRELLKKRLTNIFMGIGLMLAAWLIVDTGLKLLFDNERFGMWNEIQCVDIPLPEGESTVSPGGAPTTPTTPTPVGE